MTPTTDRQTETERRYLQNLITAALRLGNWKPILQRRYPEERSGYEFSSPPTTGRYLSDVRVTGYKLEVTVPPKLLPDRLEPFYPAQDNFIITDLRYLVARKDLERAGLACDVCGNASRPKHIPPCIGDPCQFKRYLRGRSVPYEVCGDGLYLPSKRGRPEIRRRAEMQAEVSSIILAAVCNVSH